jgi:hypothetical protein
LPIVEYLDELSDLPDSLFSGFIARMMGKLLLKCTPEALYGRIIEAVDFRCQALLIEYWVGQSF